MDELKFSQVVNYFTENHITLPTDVKNSIEDVFMENDNVETVQCYHVSELDEFQKDLKFYNEIKLYLDGNNKGTVHNVWTYHGQVQFSLSEYVALYEKQEDIEDVVEIITDIKNDEVSRVYDAKEYSIILLETLSWDTEKDKNNTERHLDLFIYCPENIPDEE